MNNWIIGGLIAVAIGGGIFLFGFSDGVNEKMMEGNEMTESDVMKKEEHMTSEGDAMTEEKPASTGEGAMMKEEGAMTEGEGTAKGSYETYAPETLARAESGDVVLFFRASWCPTCKVLDSDIRANLKNIPSGVTILDVNYDTETALKQKYGVTYQHTLVQVDASGKLITKWSGGQTLASLLTNVR
jgi:thiol-disulfide isomerase/thioredoxin